jgi:hypothetical protein
MRLHTHLLPLQEQVTAGFVALIVFGHWQGKERPRRIPKRLTRSSRNRLNAVVDLIFDALPDLVGAHVRIFH